MTIAAQPRCRGDRPCVQSAESYSSPCPCSLRLREEQPQRADADPPPASTRVVSLSGRSGFGAVEIGKTSDLTLTIGNSGTGTLSVTGITSPDGYALNWTNGTIAPGGSQQVAVRFAPTAARSYDGTLTVNGDHTSGTNTAALSGAGITPAPPPAPPPRRPPRRMTNRSSHSSTTTGEVSANRRWR